VNAGISFEASLSRITTTIDGGWKVTFDVPQSDAESMLALSEYRDKILQIGIVVRTEGES